LVKELAYAPNPDVELELRKRAFLNIAVFKSVFEFYKGSNLPEMKYLGNTLASRNLLSGTGECRVRA
jgi:hypothetical protein